MRLRLANLFGRATSAYVVLAIGLVVSAAATYLVARDVENDARLKFEGAVSDSPEAIEARIRAYSDILLGIRGMYLAADSVSRSEFRSYIESLDLSRRYPGVQVIHYGERIPAAQKQAFETMVRSNTSIDSGGYPNFGINPPGERPEYVVVKYVEPMAGNETALGLDLAGDPVRLAALERTRDSGLPTASGIIALAHDPRKHPGFAMRLPIYQHGMPLDTVAQRRAAFTGVVSASFVVIDLMRGVFGEQYLQKIRVRIHDAGFLQSPEGLQPPSQENLMFDSDRLLGEPLAQADSPDHRSGLSRAAGIDVGGRRWNLTFSAREGFVDPSARWLPLVALLGGGVISLLLFGLTRALATSGSRAVELANRITEDLRKSEAQFGEAQRMTQQLIEVLPNPVFFKDTEGRYIGVNRAWESYFGIPRSAFVGKTVFELYPDNREVAERLDAMDQVLWRSPGAQTYETSITTPDGRRHDAIYYKATFSRTDGNVAGLIGTIVDITERKELERRFRETFDQAAVGIVHTSLDGKYLQVNQRFCEMLGYSQSELLGREAADFTHPDDRERGRQSRRLMWEGKLRNFNEEKRYLRKNGSVIWTNRTVSLARDASGNPAYFIRVIEDITERKEIEERYRATFDSAPVGIMHTAVDSYKILRANRKLAEMLGYTQDELLGMTSTDVVHPDYRFSDRSKYMDPIRNDEFQTFASERKFIRKDGSALWVNRTVSLVRDAADNPLYFIRIVEDISERKQAEQRQAMEHAITRVLAEAETLAEAIPRIMQTICETMGWHCGARWQMDKQAGLLRCRETWGFDTPEISAFIASNKERTVEPAPVGQGLVRRTYAAGKPVWITDITQDQAFNRRMLAERANLHGAFGFPLLGGGEVLGVMEFFHRDVREPDEMLIQIAQSIGSQIGQYMVRMQAEEAVKFVATHDALTGLPNRVMFNQRLGHAIAQAQRYGRRLAVLFIDLDRFKIINDTLGHEAGDMLLREVATRLTVSLRATDTVGRLGGDEFVVLVEEIVDPLYLAGVSQKLITALSAGFPLSGREYHVTASIGVSTYPDDGQDLQALLKNADIAMYRAKEQGRNSFQFYSAQMNVHSVERLTLESGLRHALERHELVLHYQPQIDIRRGHITGMEALARWQHPELGLLGPDRFIHIAEETGLIVPIGEWVLQTACEAQRVWQSLGFRDITVAVNLSPRQFVYGDLLKDVMRALEQTGCDAHCLELEITESMVMHNPERAVELINRLKEMGVSVAIDDFGTGYSSLAHLKRFPIDSLKIDRSFILDIPGDKGDAAITQAVIAMAHSLELKVIAEGVETREQFNFLRKYRCDEMQGYYFSAPLPAEDAAALLRQLRANSA